MALLKEKGVELEQHPSLQVREYIYDMAPVMRAADLVICRAGASTISELTALGVPALIVSFWGSLGASGMNRQMADFLALEAAKEPFHHIHGAGKSG